MILWLVFKLEISYNRVINISRDFGFLLVEFFEDRLYIFAW
jgi:hypothetical protein